MDDDYAKRGSSIFLLVMLFWMALLGQVTSDVFDEMKEKRAFPEVRGRLALKRSALETVAMFNDEAKSKRAFEDIVDDDLDRIPSNVDEPHVNIRNEPDMKRTDFSERERAGIKRGQFQSKRVIQWPDDLQLEISGQREYPNLKRRFNEVRGLMSAKRRNYQIDEDSLAEKRDRFSEVRGDLAWKRQGVKEGYPDSRQMMLEDERIRY